MIQGFAALFAHDVPADIAFLAGAAFPADTAFRSVSRSRVFRWFENIWLGLLVPERPNPQLQKSNTPNHNAIKYKAQRYPIETMRNCVVTGAE